MIHTSIRVQPGRTLLAALFFVALGYGIAVMGWRSGHLYSLIAIGSGIILFGMWMVLVAIRQAARIARTFSS